ncbi:sigma factor [Aliamphritea spongicola]|nr:sigma factor [Aliamphritea spongicola]
MHQDEAGDARGQKDESGKLQNRADVSTLYTTYRQDLLLHLQSMVKDRDIAEELLHDTFIRVSKLPAISAIRKPRPFLIKTARNLALDYLRQQKSGRQRIWKKWTQN